MKIVHGVEPVVEFWQLLPDSFKAEEKLKTVFPPRVQTCTEGYFHSATQVTPTENLCASKITQYIWHPSNHSENNDTSLCACELLCANFQQSYPPLISLFHNSTENISTPQCRKMSCCLCALELLANLWDSIGFTGGALQCRSSSPSVFLCTRWSLQSLLY